MVYSPWVGSKGPDEVSHHPKKSSVCVHSKVPNLTRIQSFLLINKKYTTFYIFNFFSFFLYWSEIDSCLWFFPYHLLLSFIGVFFMTVCVSSPIVFSYFPLGDVEC